MSAANPAEPESAVVGDQAPRRPRDSRGGLFAVETSPAPLGGEALRVNIMLTPGNAATSVLVP